MNIGGTFPALEAVLIQADAQTWLDRLGEAEIPCGPIQDVAQVLEHPQIRARGMLIEARTPSGAPLRVAGLPIKFAGHAAMTASSEAPRLDGHRAALLEELGLAVKEQDAE